MAGKSSKAKAPAGKSGPAVKKSDAPKKSAPAAKSAAKAAAPAKSAAAAKSAPKKPSLDFIGFFPMRRGGDDKKDNSKKQPVGPVFPQGEYKVATQDTPLGKVIYEEFEKIHHGKHATDKLRWNGLPSPFVKTDKTQGAVTPPFHAYSKELYDAVATKKVDIAVQNMKDIPLDLPPGLVLASTLRREDPRDAMVTRSTYGAIQELPTRARIGTTSKRRIMQIRSVRSDIEIVPIFGDIPARMDRLESDNLDAVVLSWASLRRLNLSPRFYVALQADQMLPAACQGIVGVVCRAEDADLVAKLRYIEDSEASWASRCERAFLHKIGGHREASVGAYAHRKGTQDPWILDAVIGDATTGELIKHREIGTSRCKPESLADKAFTGILSKGARKFLPFR